jgi:hypothetical protein
LSSSDCRLRCFPGSPGETRRWVSCPRWYRACPGESRRSSTQRTRSDHTGLPRSDFMPTFIDESGNTGVHGRGGSAYFRLAAVWVPSHDVAREFREKVRQLRRSLCLRTDYEFKFANTHFHPDRRKAFFTLALTIPFRFVVSSIDKNDPHWNRGDGPEQHWSCATELAAILRPTYLAAEMEKDGQLREPVVVDDNRDHAFLDVVKRQFRALPSRKYPSAKLVGRVSFRDSGPDEMLQLVDMVCGATGAFMDSSHDEWYGLIADRDLQPSIAR